ncbi:MAG: IS4 family transposase [Armatimonadetes bacterium]|nr:IS4 family transposase [Armatimonadota bacterium]
MARTVARLTDGVRVTDYISLGVVSKAIPLVKVKAVLSELGRASRRQRELPAHVVVYYVVALALFMQVSYREVLRCLLEGLQWLLGPEHTVQVTGKSGISQARTRLGWEVLQRLHDEIVGPVAQPTTRGAWYREWRLATLDGSVLDVADTAANDAAFGRHQSDRGPAGFPQVRFVSLVENGTHVLFGSLMGPYATGEVTLAQEVVKALKPGMLCLADRLFYGFPLWERAAGTGADLVWRVKQELKLPCLQRLPDGSYLSRVCRTKANPKDPRNWRPVRVICYTLEGATDAEPCYRLITTILDPQRAPAEELAALYHERWEIETAFDEFKTHLRGGHLVLRSKTPDLVRQEFYGFLLAHFAIRGLMHDAALQAGEDPDRLSFIHSVRVVRRHLMQASALSPSDLGGLA